MWTHFDVQIKPHLPLNANTSWQSIFQDFLFYQLKQVIFISVIVNIWCNSACCCIHWNIYKCSAYTICLVFSQSQLMLFVKKCNSINNKSYELISPFAVLNNCLFHSFVGTMHYCTVRMVKTIYCFLYSALSLK